MTPSWRLEDEAVRRLGPIGLVRRLVAAARPLIALIRQAGPGQGVAILALQVGAAIAAASGLLVTTDVFATLLGAGTNVNRMVRAVPALAVVATAYAVRGALDTATALAQARLVPAVRRHAENRIMTASLNVELTAFDDPSFYDRLHRARDRAVPHIERATENGVELLRAVFALVAALGAAGALHPILLPVLFAAVVPEGWAALRSARLEFASMTATVTLSRRLWMLTDLGTRRESATEIRAAQAQRFLLDDYRAAADALVKHQTTVGLRQVRVRAAGRALAAIGMAATYVTLMVLLDVGWLALAVAGTAVIAIRASAAALTRLILAGNQIVEHSLYITDYRDFLVDAELRTRSATGHEAPDAPQVISLCEVTLRYPGTETSAEPALNAVSLDIHKGQTVALVGENGSGKTTLAKVIAGLYQPSAGSVRWDGVDLRDLRPDTVSDKVVMVLQDSVRWPSTARENVRAGRHERDDPDDRALSVAAAEAGADTVIDGLPRRWNTLLSKHFVGGHELSTGQWQRIIIARGLFRDGPLLIWDEPTAPLDIRAETAVYESLRRLAVGRTVVLITHRLASVRDADRIFVLHRGRLVEQGSHETLLAEGGHYAQLWQLQSRLFGGEAREDGGDGVDGDCDRGHSGAGVATAR